MSSTLSDEAAETVEALDNTDAPPARRRRSRRASGQHWSRVLHVYLSMVCFAVVLFFSVTGLTLNHPTWTLGGDGSETTGKGTLPAAWIGADGEIDWLATAEFLRAEHGLKGAVADREATATDASITFKAPGYSADAFINVPAGDYTIVVSQQGPLGVLNDLHKGRDARGSWRWLIDASAVFLILVSFTGLVLQLFLRRRRTSALYTVAGGTVIVALITWLALR